MVIDGKSGLPVWNQELPWQRQQLDALSVMTLDRKSVFLFWADETQRVLKSLVSTHPFFTLKFLWETHATSVLFLLSVKLNLTCKKPVRDISYFDILTSLSLTEHRSFCTQILHHKALLTEILHPQTPKFMNFIFSCSQHWGAVTADLFPDQSPPSVHAGTQFGMETQTSRM